MRIGISTLRSVLHDSSSFNKRSEDFIRQIEQELNSKINVAPIEDYNYDIKLIFIESGGSEMLFKKEMNKMKEPFFFLTSGEDNSLAASLEILTYLNSIGKKGEIIHGSIKYIGERIKELTIKKSKPLLDKRYGVIGTPSDWLISSIPSYEEVKDKLGAELIDIPLDKLINAYNNEEIEQVIDPLNLNKQDVINATKVYQILKRIINEYQLDGFTIRCFDLLSTIKTTGCLALAKLNQEGYIATCEGDIMAMLSMALIKQASGQSSFQANPSRINVDDNTILFAHCTVPLDMVSSYKYDTHFESGIGVAIKGEMLEKEITIFRLSKDLTQYFISKGKIIENLNKKNLCRTQILVKLDCNVKELLNNPKGNHHMICYGDFEQEILQLIS